MTIVKMYRGQELVGHWDDKRRYDEIMKEVLENDYKNYMTEIDYCDLAVGGVHIYAENFTTRYHTRIITQ